MNRPRVTLTIQVTKQDIDKGVRCSWCFCPVANAIRRVTGKTVEVKASKDFRFIASFPDGSSLLLPPGIHSWITRYDHGEPVEPFSFDLRNYPVVMVAK